MKKKPKKKKNYRCVGHIQSIFYINLKICMYRFLCIESLFKHPNKIMSHEN